MEREIKFRVWDEPVKEMYYDPIIAKTDRDMRLSEIFNRLSKDGWVWMQYTGLKDKNGKEIYKGDIVTDHSKRSTSIREVNGEVIFFEDYGGYAIAIYSDDYKERYIHRLDSYGAEVIFKEWEVIGNIYENPNLIEDNK